MSKDKRHTRSKKEFLTYLKGDMGAKSAHEFESEVLKSGFEQDALDGYEGHDPEEIASDLKKLQDAVPGGGYAWIGWTAAAIVLVISGYFIWPMLTPVDPQENLALKKDVEKTQPKESDDLPVEDFEEDTEEPPEDDVSGQEVASPSVQNQSPPQNQPPPQNDLQTTPVEEEPEPAETDPITLSQPQVATAAAVIDTSANEQEGVTVDLAEIAADEVVSTDPPITETESIADMGTDSLIEFNLAAKTITDEDISGAGPQARSAPVRLAEETIATPVEPAPVGGREALDTYIANNKVYPDSASVRNISGTVRLNVTISSTGMVSDVQVVRGLGSGCDEEAIRLINEWSDGWQPATLAGEPVEGDFEIAIDFP